MNSAKPPFSDPDDSVKYDKERRHWFGMPDGLGFALWEDVMDGDRLTQDHHGPAPRAAYLAWVQRQMDQGLILPVTYERALCNRCFKVRPLRNMAWCGRCGIKHNLKLRLEQDPNLDAIRANIDLFKRLLKHPVASPAGPDAPTGYAELIEVYEEHIDEFMD